MRIRNLKVYFQNIFCGHEYHFIKISKSNFEAYTCLQIEYGNFLSKDINGNYIIPTENSKVKKKI